MAHTKEHEGRIKGREADRINAEEPRRIKNSYKAIF
jgi:hypothetical protein